MKSPPPPMERTGRAVALPPLQEGLLLGAAATWVLFWGAWAILQSDLPSGPDAFFFKVWELYKGLTNQNPLGLLGWIEEGGAHPPLPLLFGITTAFLTSPQREMLRLACLGLHLLLIFQVRGLVLALTACRTSALIACWGAATLPVLAGWFRMDFPEPLVSVLLLATARVAVRTSLDSFRSAAWLGFIMGVGILTKLSYSLFALLPGIYFLVTTVRRRAHLRHALVTVGTASLVGGWWFLFMAEMIRENFQMSTHKELDLGARLPAYFVEVPENLVLTTLALAGAILASRRGGYGSWKIGLLVTVVGGGYAWLLLMFDVQQRYMVPLLAPAIVLAGAGLAVLVGLARVRTQRLAILVILPGLLALSLWANTQHRKTPMADPYVSRGLISPDVDDISGLRRAHQWITARAPWYLILTRFHSTSVWLVDQHLAVLELDDISPVTSREGLLQRELPPGPFFVLEVGITRDAIIRGLRLEKQRGDTRSALWQWFIRQKKSVRKIISDQADMTFTIYQLPTPDLKSLKRKQGTDGVFGLAIE